jgi:hypothetical protein
MFDPEKVDRFETGEDEYGQVCHNERLPYVLASDYDQLLELYRGEKAKMKALIAGVKKNWPKPSNTLSPSHPASNPPSPPPHRS